MTTARLEAFSDGVLAIIITLTVLNIHVPDGTSLVSLLPVVPIFTIYAWSFFSVGTYWNNHHHLMAATRHVSARIMWANLHLLFWLSLIPFTTEWLGLHFGQPIPSVIYCAVLFFAAVAYTLLEWAIIATQGRDSALARVLGHDAKGKVSLAAYFLAVVAAFVYPWVSYLLFVGVSIIWFVPDRRVLQAERIEKTS
jgi:uncharacterized membrane protein